MAAIADVWRVPAYLPYLQPKLTAATVKRAEKQLGVKLPASYIALLEVQNGGYVRRRFPDEWFLHSRIWGIGPHYPSITLAPGWRMLDDDVMPRDERRLVPFDGDGHWYLCLDYRGRDEPVVTAITFDPDRDRRVAKTFDAFLKKLVPDAHPGALGVTDAITLRKAITALERPLRASFGQPQASDNGYPIAKAQLKKQPPEWVWISENRVPRGFARKGERNYDQRETLLPGTALRFPEHPEVSVIVDCTDGVVERVREACRRAGLATTAL